MLAILISSETLQEVLTHQMDVPDHEPICDPRTYIRSTRTTGREWYYVRGYVGELNKGVISWTVLPAYYFEKNFEYNPVKIKTDWDQIVRK